MGKGSSSTTTSAPPWEYTAGYYQALQAAQNVASQPYQSYQGNLVAGLTPDQQQSIQQTEGLQGVTAPYINQAQNYFSQATQPLINSIPTASSGLLEQLPNSALSLTGASLGNLYSAAPTFDINAIPQYNPNYQFNPNGIPQFSSQALNQYENPYQQQVVGATEQQFANMNAQQQEQLKGNAISAGAWGGDRAAVAQGILGGQQTAQQAPVIAGLESQGFNTALGEFNTQQQANIQAQEQAAQLGQSQAAQATGFGLQEQQTAAQLGLQRATAQSQLEQSAAAQQMGFLQQQQQTELGANEANAWLASQAAFGNAQLGSEALNSGLTEAGALMNAGSLQQQQAQEQLNVPYEQYLAKQAAPFQTTGWLANIAEGLGGASGGTSTTTGSGASPISQGAGLLTAGIGAAGQAGLFSGIGSGAAAGAGAAGFVDTGALAADTGSLAVAPAAAADSGGIFAGIGDAIGSLFHRGGGVPHRGPGGPISSAPPMGGASPVGLGSPVPSAPPVGGMAPVDSSAIAGLGSPVSGTSPVSGLAPNGSAPVPTGVPDVSVTAVPSGSGMSGGKPKDSAVMDEITGQPRGPGTDFSKMVKDSSTTTTKSGGSSPIPAILAAIAEVAAMAAAKGGRIEHKRAAGGLLPHFDDGGAMLDQDPDRLEETGGYQLIPSNVPMLQPASASPPRRVVAHRNFGSPPQSVIDVPALPAHPQAPQDEPGSAGLGGGSTPTGLAPQSGITVTSDAPNAGKAGHVSPWLPVIAAGLGMMAGRSRDPLTNIGQGALTGLKEYTTEQQYADRQAERQQTLNMTNQRLRSEQDRMAETGRHNQQNEQQAAERLHQLTLNEQQRLALETQAQADRHEYQGSELGLRQQALDQGHYTYQPGVQAGPDGTVQGTWRYSTRGDEPPQFFPGVTQERNVAEQRRSEQGDQRLSIAQQELGLRQQAQQRGMSDQAIRVWLGTRDPITGKPTMKPEEAEQAAAGFRSSSTGQPNQAPQGQTPQGQTPQAPRAPAAPPMPHLGDVQQGYRFTGGNPADPRSWQQIGQQ